MDDPSLLPAIITRDAEIVYAPHWFQADGTTPIKNSDDKPFPKIIEEQTSVAVIHAIKHKLFYTDAEYHNELNAINIDAWRFWEPGQAWISRILTEDTKVNEINCTKIHYIIRCSRLGYNVHIPQMGIVDGNLEFLDAMGEVTSTPVDADIPIKHEINFAATLGF